MADKENQHFVPQYYFRFFSKDQKSVSLLRKTNGTVVKTAPIKGQASKSYFYGDAAVERKITEIESSFIASLKKIRREKDFSLLSEEETLSILQAITFQRSRTLGNRVNGKPQQDFFAKAMAEIAINTSQNLTDAEKQDLRKLIEFVEADPIPFQGMQMEISIMQADHLADLDRIVIKNRTKRPFILSDAPALLINPLQQKVTIRGVLGMLTPGIIWIFPLSSRLAIMFIDKNGYKVKGKTKGALNIKSVADVDELNKLQILNATNAVYFDGFEFAPYIVSLWKEARKNLSDGPKGVVQEGILMDAGQEREIVHFYEKQLPVMPKFSFLQYEEVDEHSQFMTEDYGTARAIYN